MSDIISSDPNEQAGFEIYVKGFEAGTEEERQRIIELLEHAIKLINEKEQHNG